MTKIKTIAKDDFTLKKVKISNEGVSITGTEKRTVDGKTEEVQVDLVAKYMPHVDLVHFRDQLKPYLAQAFGLTRVFDMSMNYLASGKKTKVQELMDSILDDIEVTSISIGGTEQLRGVVVSGKMLSWNDSKCAMNTPRIVFSSDKLGFESDVEKIIDMIEIEAYNYFYEGKTSDITLFDQGNDQEENSDVQGSKESKKEKDLAVA